MLTAVLAEGVLHRPVKSAPESGHPPSMKGNQELQSKEWEAPYDELGTLLERRGTQNPLGDSDFWVVDENYGKPQHKVCVARISFLTRPLALEVQRTLRKYSLGWEVMFSLDKTELRPTEEDMGTLVRKSDVKEYWSAERMRKALGNEFRWTLSIADKWLGLTGAAGGHNLPSVTAPQSTR